MTLAVYIRFMLSNITYFSADHLLFRSLSVHFFLVLQRTFLEIQKQQERCLVWFRQRSCYLSYELKKYSDSKYTTHIYQVSSDIKRVISLLQPVSTWCGKAPLLLLHSLPVSCIRPYYGSVRSLILQRSFPLGRNLQMLRNHGLLRSAF